jgi:intein-encoded DNA endonuclease-like protein
MSPGEKRGTWRRITMIGTSWRFNKYAERALACASVDVGEMQKDGETKSDAQEKSAP